MEDKIVRRKGDDSPNSIIEVSLVHDGDIIIHIKGTNRKGEPSDAQIEFCAPFGGGYHPWTIRALYDLVKAIEKDNLDKKSPQRYKIKTGWA